MTARDRRTVALGAITMALWATSGVHAQSSHRLLDVPYVSQTADLCGAAALAMVRRYWGVSAAASDFAYLVEPVDGGIRTGRLVDAAASPGWQVLPLAASGPKDPTVATRLDQGQPVIALILDRPGVFHYVVIVGWTDRDVVYHDPARRPLMRLPIEEFDARWQPAGRWMMAVVRRAPAGTAARPPERAAPERAVPPPCLRAIDAAVSAAALDRLDDAARTLIEAMPACPGVSALPRELAAVRFRQADWSRAEAIALDATAIDAGDADAWRLAGTARYMQGNLVGALNAFNRAGEPSIDRVIVRSESQTPDPIVVAATGLDPQQVLTDRQFARAARRLADLPVASRADLRFVPAAESGVDVEAAVVEHARGPSGWTDWMFIGANAALYDTVRADFAGLADSGEAWHGAWRWTPNRPMVEFSLATPTPGGRPGVVTVSGLWETQTFARSTTPFAIARSRASISLADWATGSIAWTAGVAFDRIDAEPHVAFSAGVDRRWLTDRLSTSVSIEGWLPGTTSRRFARGDVVIAYRSSTESTPRVMARAGMAGASTAAPMIVWPTAGIGRSRTATLRAHALHRDGIVTGDGFGRGVAFASVEYARPIQRITAARTSWAVFVDAARVSHRPERGPVTHVDVGTGLRFDVPGYPGTLMLDVAYGAVDGRVRFSASIRPRWPGR